MNPRPSPSPKIDKMPLRVAALAFASTYVFCTITAHVLVRYSSHSTKNEGMGDCQWNNLNESVTVAKNVVQRGCVIKEKFLKVE
jgi:hypothetical protein